MDLRPVLKRFDVYVFKNKSGTDGAQVPVNGATIDFYAQGATAKGPSVTFHGGDYEPLDVNVYHIGALAPGTPARYVIVDGVDTKKLQVMGTNSATGVVTLKQTGLSDIVVAAANRLISQSDLLAVYSDPLGTIAKSPTTTGVDGRFWAYVKAFRFDYRITVPGETAKRLFIDAEGSYVMRT